MPLWLKADDDTPYAERARREREIARTLGTGDGVTQVRGWWRSLTPGTRRDQREDPRPRVAEAGAGARLDRLRALAALVMVLLGMLAGVSLALAAFRYDGSQPVNVVFLLALLVGLQLLFLLLTLLLLTLGRVPGLRGLQELLAALNPGAWAASVLARLARADVAQGLFDRGARAGAGRFAKWQMLVWSQVAAVALNVAALATAVALVTFTDLAFGWSTTLSVDSSQAARIARAIAWPWQALVPSAVPAIDLVEQSQFFRLDSGGGSENAAVDSRVLAGWWPFTLCAIVVYGLLPRIVLLVVAGVRLRVATRDLLLDDPRVAALIDRMRSPVIETEADRHDELDPSGEFRAKRLDHALVGRAVAVVWEGAVAAEAAALEARRRFGLDVVRVLEAGGARGLEGDRRALESLEPQGDALLVFTPAWEPPVLELLDFLRAARERVGDRLSIVVVPLPDGDRAVTDVEVETWKRGVGRLKDPRIYVEAGAQ